MLAIKQAKRGGYEHDPVVAQERVNVRAGMSIFGLSFLALRYRSAERADSRLSIARNPRCPASRHKNPIKVGTTPAGSEHAGPWTQTRESSLENCAKTHVPAIGNNVRVSAVKSHRAPPGARRPCRTVETTKCPATSNEPSAPSLNGCVSPFQNTMTGSGRSTTRGSIRAGRWERPAQACSIPPWTIKMRMRDPHSRKTRRAP